MHLLTEYFYGQNFPGIYNSNYVNSLLFALYDEVKLILIAYANPHIYIYTYGRYMYGYIYIYERMPLLISLKHLNHLFIYEFSISSDDDDTYYYASYKSHTRYIIYSTHGKVGN